MKGSSRGHTGILARFIGCTSPLAAFGDAFAIGDALATGVDVPVVVAELEIDTDSDDDGVAEDVTVTVAVIDALNNDNGVVVELPVLGSTVVGLGWGATI